MNTNEFYKELFEKYALDQDKIRLEAIKQAKTPAWKRAVGTYWKTAAGIAAAAAVTVGVVAYTASSSPDINITVSKDSALSATQRLYDAEQSYLNQDNEDETRTDIYVTFRYPLSYSEMAVSLSAVSDFKELDVTLSDGERISDPTELSVYAEGSGNIKNITAAKIRAAASCFRDIHDLSCTYSAEMASGELNDDTFTPMPVTEDLDPLISDIQDNSAQISVTEFAFEAPPAVTATETTSSARETAAPMTERTESISAASGTTAAVTSPRDEETSYVPDDQEPSGDADEQTGAADFDPDDTPSTPVSSQGQQPEESSEDEDPEGVDPGRDDYDEEAETTLPAQEETDIQTSLSAEQPEAIAPVTEISAAGNYDLVTNFYSLNVENSLETKLIGDNAIVLTRNCAYFYRIGGVVKNTEPKICETESPKFAYFDDDTVVLTGIGSDGLRSRIIVFETESGNVYSCDAGINLGGSEIAGIRYSRKADRYFVKAVSSTKTYMYEITIEAENGIIFRPLFEFDGAVSAAGFSSDILYFTASLDNVNYSLYSFDCVSGDANVIKELGSGCKVKRSLSFESFIVSAFSAESEERVSYVYDTNAKKLIPVNIDAGAQIASAGGIIYIRSGDTLYTLSADDALTETSVRGIAFEYTPGSDFEITEANSEKVVIAEKNRNIW